jgi:hypothetical protein
MKVKELIEQLNSLDPEMDIYIQKDSEGNGFEKLSGADPDGVLIQFDKYEFEIYDASWDATEADMDEDEWEEYKANPRVLVLYP